MADRTRRLTLRVSASVAELERKFKGADKYMEYLISTKIFHPKLNFIPKLSKYSFQSSNVSRRFNFVPHPTCHALFELTFYLLLFPYYFPLSLLWTAICQHYKEYWYLFLRCPRKQSHQFCFSYSTTTDTIICILSNSWQYHSKTPLSDP